MNNFENPEDTKLATLASATLKRSGAQQAAALRDTTGRTYVAINIETKSLQLNALEAVFTVALASQMTSSYFPPSPPLLKFSFSLLRKCSHFDDKNNFAIRQYFLFF